MKRRGKVASVMVTLPKVLKYVDLFLVFLQRSSVGVQGWHGVSILHRVIVIRNCFAI
jgi:hypothetical protein